MSKKEEKIDMLRELSDTDRPQTTLYEQNKSRGQCNRVLNRAVGCRVEDACQVHEAREADGHAEELTTRQSEEVPE